MRVLIKIFIMVYASSSHSFKTLCLMFLFYCFILFLFDTNSLEAQRIRYVSSTPRGKQDGSSWENASSNLKKMINASVPNDQVWVEGNFDYPTNYNKVATKDEHSGVKSYIMKMCTYKDENPSSYLFFDPLNPVRIPTYSFPIIHTKSKNNPSLYLVLKIV